MLALRCNHIITPTKVIDGYIFCENDKIIGIGQEVPPSSATVVDHRGMAVLPGLVDPHVHINEPGRTEWEGFDTATKAALAGGITSLMDMPLNSLPVTTTPVAYNLKKEAALGKIHCHCGFWGGLIPGNAQSIEAMIRLGVRGFKAFLIHSGIDEFPAVTEADLREMMPILAYHRIPLLVHCELESPVTKIEGDPRSYQKYLLSRPRKWEDDAIALMIRLCGEFRCPLHIVHLSSSSSLAQVEEAKEKGYPVTAETAPHYLYFNAEEIPDGATQYKCAPPIREQHNNQALLQGLKDGIIDFVATDHSPAPPELKLLREGNFEKAWGGIASLQFSLQVMLALGRRENFSLVEICKWMSEKPARLPGLPKKGQLAPGFDADMIVLDTEAIYQPKAEQVLHRHKQTPYIGEQLSGKVDSVYLAGKKVYGAGNFLLLSKGKIL